MGIVLNYILFGEERAVLRITRFYCTLLIVWILLSLRNGSLCFEFFMAVVPFWELLRSLCYSIVSHNEIIGMTIICLFCFKSFLCSVPSIVSLRVPWCDISCLPRFQEQKPKKKKGIIIIIIFPGEVPP